MRYFTLVLVAALLPMTFVSLTGCGSNEEVAEDEAVKPRGLNRPPKKDLRKKTEMSVTTADYGTTSGGEKVIEYTCQNAHGMVMKMITYGATMTSLEVADKEGTYKNVTLGYETLAEYEAGTAYFGATVGRFCNRIAGGKFTINGQEYTLATNNEPNHLHGGEVGFNRVIWDSEPIEEEDAVGVKFTYRSVDGEEGYPGNVDVVAIYKIDNQDVLHIELEAETDAPTHVNLTNHNYWNLSGAGSGTIYDHQLALSGPQYLAVDDTLIPTGKIEMVTGTDLDFLSRTRIGDRIDKVQVGDGPKGYDHCFASIPMDIPGVVATLADPASGLEMIVSSNLLGLQFYTGNFLDGSPEVGGFEQHGAVCLETQLYPDSPNKQGVQDYTNSLLRPGRTFRNNTTIKFLVR